MKDVGIFVLGMMWGAAIHSLIADQIHARRRRAFDKSMASGKGWPPLAGPIPDAPAIPKVDRVDPWAPPPAENKNPGRAG
jgi:hypothetical protein